MSIGRTCWPVLLALGVLGACDTPTLGQGDTLKLAFQTERLHPQQAPEALPASAQECSAAGGAVVDVRAWEEDGVIPRDAEVTLWLSPSTGASLFVLGPVCKASERGICMQLDNAGAGQACLLPGEETGTVGVFAHSGIIETSATLMVSERILTTGSSLTLGIAPGSAVVAAPAQASVCNVPAPPPCFPGQLRRARVTLFAAGPAEGSPPPDGTRVYLNADAGWLARPGQCAAAYEGSSPPASPVELTQGAATLDWCFGDVGAAATLTARSGPVEATARLEVPAIPTGLRLIASQVRAAVGEQVVLSATLTGCDSRGIGETPVLFSATQGQATFAPTGAVETSARGVASVTATVTPPVTVNASVAEAPGISCSVTVEAP